MDYKGTETVEKKQKLELFSIIAITLVIFAEDTLTLLGAVGCLIWAKKKKEDLANVALIIAIFLFFFKFFWL